MTTNIQVVCRFRPVIPGQERSNIQIADNKSVIVDQSNVFNFDRVFHPGTQEEVFDFAAKPIIEAVLEGFNGTVVAYGQTGSGKTHTMEGGSGENAGVLKRMVNTIFEFIENSAENQEFRIKISVVELYMEKIRDLQTPKKTDLKIREDKNQGIYIQDVTETSISDKSEIYDILKKSNSNRQIQATQMNEQSSRSHMIFFMTITSIDTRDQSAKTGKLFLVDLAGSEKVSKTGAEGKVLEEAKGINKSLSALGQVINALTDGSQHISYRDSKLTRILQCSFGGNSRTTLIVTCSPAQFNLQETLSTLRFGVRAKSIKNKPKINKEHTVEELKMIVSEKDKEILLLQEMLSQYKKNIVISEDDRQMINEIKEDLIKPINQEKINQLQDVNLKQEMEIQQLSSKIFQLNQQNDELKVLLQQKDDENFERVAEFESQIEKAHGDFQKKLSLICTTLNSKLQSSILEQELLDPDVIGKAIESFLKEKITSKLKQINYLYKKHHHKDNQSEQVLAFISDIKADCNIQSDQLNELNNQIHILKQQNSKLMDLNEYQNSLLDTLEKTKLLLEAEKERSCKLEAQLNQKQQAWENKVQMLSQHLQVFGEKSYKVILQKKEYQKLYEKAGKEIRVKDNKITKLMDEIQRLSIENQQLFVKYDILREQVDLDKEGGGENTFYQQSYKVSTAKKLQKPLKGGTKYSHKQSASMMLEKENLLDE